MESFSQDPIGFNAGDPNLYRYVENQATVSRDPSGLVGGPLDTSGTTGRAQYIAQKIWEFLKLRDNTAHMPPVKRAYVVGGTIVADGVGIRGMSDAFARDDAIDAHVQSTSERIVDGVTGGIQFGTTVAGIRTGASQIGKGVQRSLLRKVDNVAEKVDDFAEAPNQGLTSLAPRGSVWDDLPLRSNSYGAGEQAAGSFVGRRIAAARNTPDGLYKFVVDTDGKVWLANVADDVPHSALIPRGQQVRGAGYVNIKNGRANVNGRSGHFMAEEPFLGRQAELYDRAIRDTFSRHGIEVIDNNVGLGSGLLRPPGS